MNVADDMPPALENDLAASDRTFDHSGYGSNRPFDESPARDDERLAVQFALDLFVELDQALGSDPSFNLQSFGDDRFASGPEHERLHALDCAYHREKKRGA